MIDIWTKVVLVGAAGSFAAYLVLRHARQIARASNWLVRIPRSRLAVFLAFAFVATLCAQKSGTNAPPQGAAPPQMMALPSASAPQLTMPANAVRAENWWRRGAWDDVRRVEFPPGWVFPFGSNHLSSVDVVSQGSLRRRWTDTNEIASVGLRLALAPFSSAFWHEFTPSNSCRLVWSGALAERRADAPVDAAIELFRDGSATVRTNGVARLAERAWVYGETNCIVSRAEAESAAAGDWQYVFAVNFPSAPPEAVCLCVGTNRVAVSSAGECCFVLNKGTRYGISLSFVPDGVTCSWGFGTVSQRSMRAGLVTERMRAYGLPGEVDFDDPTYDGEGSILWNHSLYISPDSEEDPTYPMHLLAWMDVPPGSWPTVTWSGDDGAISQTGEWLTLEDRPESGVVDVTATYKGRTWRGQVVFWTDVAEDVVALDGGGTLFVESAYTNEPASVTVRTSTQQKLTAHWALCNDGTLSLSATEGAAVDVRVGSPDGPAVDLPYCWGDRAGEVGYMDFYVTNNDPSRAGENVTFELEFVGDIEGFASDTSGLLKVVKYRVEADANWPSNKIRHVFGPLETFKAIIENGPEFIFTAPLTPGECSMSFDYNGSTCTFPIRVIPPNGVTGTLRFYDSDSFSSFIGAGFTAYVQVLPTYVSFAYELRIMEDEAGMAGQWGCFKNYSSQYPPELFAHTVARGARNPRRILSENMVEGHDHARTDLVDFPPEDGGYHMNIPLKWGVEGGPYTHDAGHVVQTISVQANGTVSVSKFGITARRKPDEDYQ